MSYGFWENFENVQNKIFFLGNLWGQKIKISKNRDSHLRELVILHHFFFFAFSFKNASSTDKRSNFGPKVA